MVPSFCCLQGTAGCLRKVGEGERTASTVGELFKKQRQRTGHQG